MKKLLILTLISTLFIAGCSKGDNEKVSEFTQDDSQSQPAVMSNEDYLKEINTLNTLNKGVDLDKCNDLKDSNVREACKESVEFNIAIKSNDLASCSKFNIEKKLECEMTIKSLSNSNPSN